MKPFCSIHLKILILFIIFFAFSLSAEAQLFKKYPGYRASHFKSMRYGLFVPENYDSKKIYPLIVYLHGSTDTVSRDLSWYQQSIQKENPCFVLTPKCLVADQGWGNTWSNNHADATAKTIQLVDSLIKTYSIDNKRLYLYGISMGGFGTLSVLQKNSGKFAAAYVVCGGGDEKAVDKMVQTPLWIFHGDSDDIVLPKYSKSVYDEILKLGGKKIRYTEYAGVKHNSWENVSREKTLSRWLFSQRKGRESVAPNAVNNLSIELQQNKSTKLNWDKPIDSTEPDKKVWYYKVYRNQTFLSDVDGETTDYIDSNTKIGVEYTYHIVTVNYFFAESLPSQTVQIKL